ncbi:MAG: anti-sigma regulatory factor [Gammaproteobacteria bacterium]|nr:MAG: anti-sigma regulatory factor [Gammaproteobacteria bacterium]
MTPAQPASHVLPLKSDEDVVRLRKQVREDLVALGFSLIEQTKMVTAASELARNTLRYGGGGEAHIDQVEDGSRRGLSLSFIDQGPGIEDIGLALTDGYTSGNGLGLGLSGAKRLADDFAIDTAPGRGTTVKIAKWKPF